MMNHSILIFDKDSEISHKNKGNSITSPNHAEFETWPEYSQQEREFINTNQHAFNQKTLNKNSNDSNISK
jgi:hypothetical protein